MLFIDKIPYEYIITSKTMYYLNDLESKIDYKYYNIKRGR